MNKKVIVFIAAALCILSVFVTGCGCQKSIPSDATTTESTARSETVPLMSESETVLAPTIEATETVVTEATTEPTRETAKETTDDDIFETLPVPNEDTRPPIEVTLPDETQPYTDYEMYNNMTAEEQETYFKSFEDPDDFFAWYNQAKAEYDAAHPPIIIDGSTNIEIVP